MRKRRKHHNFWHEWDEEKGRRGMPHGRRHKRRRADAWRIFFHDYMNTWPEDHWAFQGRRFNPWRQGLDDFNPLVASLLSKGGGLLPLYVLHLLNQADRYGNEIMDKLTERTEGQWVANPGAIYPLMTVLEEQGLVTGAWEDPVKRTVRVYQITDIGRQEFERLRAILKPKLQEAVTVMERLATDLNGDDGPSEVV